jgi:hypothetical protein
VIFPGTVANYGTGSFTVEMAFRPTQIQGIHYLVSKNSGSFPNWGVYLSGSGGSGKLWATYNISAAISCSVSSSTTFVTGSNYFVDTVYSLGERKIYIAFRGNYDAVSLPSNGTGSLSTTSSLFIGNLTTSSSQAFSGSIYSTKIYNPNIRFTSINKNYNTQFSRLGLQPSVYTPSAPLLLNTYASASVAYSVRQLVNNYTGSLIRVRRSSDNTETNIGFDLDGNLDTTTLLTFVGRDTNNHGFVTTWYDQSGNRNHATQTATGSQPQIVNSGSVMLSGTRPSLYWKTTGLDNLQFTRISNIQSVFHTSQLVQTGPAQSFILGDTTDFDYASGESTPQTWLWQRNIVPAIESGNNFVNGIARNFQTTNRDLNRNLLTLIHTSAVGRSNQISVDRGGDRSWRGYIQEVILYPFSQTGSRVFIETDINAYYNIF